MNYLTTKISLDKFYRGDSLTDNELLELIKYFENLIEIASPLPHSYDLFKNEIQRMVYILHTFKSARNL